MNQDDSNTPVAADEKPKYYHALVLGDVVFESGNQIHNRRTQIFSKSETPEFTAGRLLHVQNCMAYQVRQELGNPADFRAIEALILNIAQIGHMSDEQFYEGVNRSPSAVTAEGNSGTVVPFPHR